MGEKILGNFSKLLPNNPDYNITVPETGIPKISTTLFRQLVYRPVLAKWGLLTDQMPNQIFQIFPFHYNSVLIKCCGLTVNLRIRD